MSINGRMSSSLQEPLSSWSNSSSYCRVPLLLFSFLPLDSVWWYKTSSCGSKASLHHDVMYREMMSWILILVSLSLFDMPVFNHIMWGRENSPMQTFGGRFLNSFLSFFISPHLILSLSVSFMFSTPMIVMIWDDQHISHVLWAPETFEWIESWITILFPTHNVVSRSVVFDMHVDVIWCLIRCLGVEEQYAIYSTTFHNRYILLDVSFSPQLLFFPPFHKKRWWWVGSDEEFSIWKQKKELTRILSRNVKRSKYHLILSYFSSSSWLSILYPPPSLFLLHSFLPSTLHMSGEWGSLSNHQTSTEDKRRMDWMHCRETFWERSVRRDVIFPHLIWSDQNNFWSDQLLCILFPWSIYISFLWNLRVVVTMIMNAGNGTRGIKID